MFKNILLIAEDLDGSVQAARMAGEAARTMDSSNLCITVTYPPVPSFLGDPGFEKAFRERLTKAEAVAESLQREVGTIPGEVQTEVLGVPLVEAVISVSQVHGSDLIVMGSPHRGPLGQAVTWHHNHQVVDHVHCPVMIVP